MTRTLQMRLRELRPVFQTLVMHFTAVFGLTMDGKLMLIYDLNFLQLEMNNCSLEC